MTQDNSIDISGSLKKIKEILGDRQTQTAEFVLEVILGLSLNVNSTILDIGTGKGYMAVLLAIQGFKVVTGEPKGDNWANWKDLARKTGVLKKIKFKHFNAEALPFENEVYNGIFLYGSLHHVADTKKAISEFLRCLQPNGILCIFEPNENGVALIRKENPNHVDGVDPRNISIDSKISIEFKKGNLFDAYIIRKI